MNMIVKFSKSYKNILSIKSDLYKGNEKHLKRTLNINSIYKRQRPRKRCINCNSKLNSPVFFSHGIKYTLCKKCNQLNGLHQITKKKGEIVAFREEIGKLGSSGRVTGPHVHYEVLYDYRALNPAKFINAGKNVFKKRYKKENL